MLESSFVLKRYFKPNKVVTFSLLFLVVLFSIGLYLWSINAHIQIYSKQVNAINKLRLLNKDFNTFALQKGSFINYDIINQKIEDFDKMLHDLESEIKASQENVNLLTTVSAIERDYHTKAILLEYIKSFNSTISSSLQYLFDLNSRLDALSLLEKRDRELIDNSLFMITQFYAGLIKGGELLNINLEKIELLTKRVPNIYLSYLYQHEKSVIEKILKIQKNQYRINHLDIGTKLDKVYEVLENRYQSYLYAEKIILLLFMTSMILMFSFILYLYKILLRDKVELQAYRYAIENSDNSIVITDKDHNITYVNEAFEKETGYMKKEVLGENPRMFKSGLMDREYYQELTDTLKKRQKWKGEFINKRKDGSIIYEKASINPIIVDGKLTHYIAIKLNITKYIEQEKKVEFLALHDQLTSLPNRLHFEQYFNQEIYQKNKEVTLLYIDLDRFKTINDSLGHHVGDALLKVFSQRLQSALDRNDFLARIGGDEFVVILDVQSLHDANKVAKRILKLLQTPIEVLGHSLSITTSIGLSFFPRDGDTLETLLKHADTAMYRAKNSGRNNFKIFTQELSDKINERLEIEQALTHAVENDAFYLVYQPKYSLKTNEIVGFEALIRWEDEKLGFIPPDKFIPIAEEIGVIHKIGLFVFAQACRDFKTLRSIHPRVKNIAINISTIQFREPHFIETLHHLVTSIGVSPFDIELELTESCIMEDIEKNIQILHELKRDGYKIAIDDFGTGYSSFAYLKKLPIDTLKIDKTFVDDITTHKPDKDIVNTIINLAKNLGFNTVAEGIEYQEQEELLSKMGCTLGQGYLFCKPQKMTEIKKCIEVKQEEKMLVTQTP